METNSTTDPRHTPWELPKANLRRGRGRASVTLPVVAIRAARLLRQKEAAVTPVSPPPIKLSRPAKGADTTRARSFHFSHPSRNAALLLATSLQAHSPPSAPSSAGLKAVSAASFLHPASLRHGQTLIAALLHTCPSTSARATRPAPIHSLRNVTHRLVARLHLPSASQSIHSGLTQSNLNSPVPYRLAMAQNQKMSMHARSGDSNQRYGPQGERLVAGLVPLSADKTKVLLIQSSRRNGWVLPKGGWELDESTAAAAACREAWEEAGVIVKIEKDLGHIADERPTSAVTRHAPKASYQFFEATVTEEKAEWPEKHKRDRQWHNYAQAIQVLAKRPELLEALRRSSIKK